MDVVNRLPWDAYAKLGAGNDIYIGGYGIDVVDGEWGGDQIFGGRGFDKISGGPGQDFLCGGTPPEGLVQWPGIVSWAGIPPYEDKYLYDDVADEIDCGKDSDADYVFAEVFVDPEGAKMLVDYVVNVDWDSPPGTDTIYE